MASSSSDSQGTLAGLTMWKWAEGASVQVSYYEDLSQLNIFQRQVATDIIKFHTKTIVNHTEMGKRQTVKLEDDKGYCHTWVHPNGLAVTVLTDQQYPMRVAYSLINEALKKWEERYPVASSWQVQTKDCEMEFPEGKELFQQFKNPLEADKICSIQGKLDEVKAQVIESMDEILRRGETLDALMEKSSELNSTSKDIYRTAKRQNSCC